MLSDQLSQSVLTEAISKMGELKKAEVISAEEHDETLKRLRPALEQPESLTEAEVMATAKTVRAVLELHKIEVIIWDLYEQVRELLRGKPRSKEKQDKKTPEKTPTQTQATKPKAPPPPPKKRNDSQKPAAKPREDRAIKEYLESISRHPLLSREEEYEIATEYRRTGDEKLKEKLINSNLRFVVSVAKSHTGSNLPILDLIQEGNKGLIRAVERFEPERGYKLVSYAGWHIGAYIRDYIGKALRTAKKEVPIGEEEEPGNNIPLDKEYRQPQNSYETAEAHINRKQLIKELLEILTKREKYVIKIRWLNGRTSGKQPTLQEIGDTLNLSRERVRQIELRAFEKMREVCSREEINDLFTPPS